MSQARTGPGRVGVLAAVHLLFSARPAFGHVYPLVPLAQAARAQGHRVTFATTDTFLDRLTTLGFETVDVGSTIDAALADLLEGDDGLPRNADGRPDTDMGGRLFLEHVARRTAADLREMLPFLQPDLVVYESYDVGAAVAAHADGVPTACHAISPRPPDEVLTLADGGRVARLWAEHGVTEPALDVFAGDVYLDIFPAVLQERLFRSDPRRMPLRPVPFSEPGQPLPAWVGPHRSRPLVYLTLGTVVATDEVLAPAIEGLAVLDVDVVLSLGSASGASLPDLPANVHVEPFVDQAALLPHVDLVVHHGGSGTVLGALRHARPQLLLPKGADQFINADLLSAAGVVEVLEPAQATPDAIATLAKRAMEAEPDAVRAVQAELLAMPSPDDVLRALAARC